MRLILLILVFNLVGTCQSIDDGWKGIKPFVSNKASVEKLLGTPTIDNNGYYGYKYMGIGVQINYSTAPCIGDQYDRGKYTIPIDSVLSYVVNFNTPTKFSELKLSSEKFVEVKDEHMLGDVWHYSKNGAIAISSYSRDGEEFVGQIIVNASKQDKEKFLCK